MTTEDRREEKVPGRLPVWVCIPLFIGIFFVFMMLFSVLARAALSLMYGAKADDLGMMGYMLLEGSMLLAALAAAVVMLRIEGRPFSELGLSVKGHAGGLWYGFLMAALIYLIGFGLSWTIEEVEVIGFSFRPLNLLAALLFFLLVALFEEIMMRGYILGHLLYTRLNKFLSLFVSAALFAFLHVFNPGIGLLPMVNLVLAGLLLGASYLYTRNLCFPLSLHLFWNWLQGPVLGYQVSGNDFMPAMLELRLPEANVLNGGTFGFEGSLICTLLMVVCTFLIIRWGEKRIIARPQSY